MASRPSAPGQCTVSDQRRNLRFVTEGNDYLLIERLLPLENVSVPGIAPQTAQAILRRAVANDTALGLKIERAFAALLPIRGVHVCTVAGIGEAAGNLLARQSLVLVNLGPALPSAITPSGVPPQPSGDRSYADKLGKVVGGIAEVPRYKVIESGRDAFDQPEA